MHLSSAFSDFFEKLFLCKNARNTKNHLYIKMLEKSENMHIAIAGLHKPVTGFSLLGMISYRQQLQARDGLVRACNSYVTQ